jgi:hypothetical protein
VSRSVRTFLPVVGDPTALAQAFDGDPQRWLPSARQEGASTWRLTVRAGSFSRPVIATVGAPWRAGRTRWRSLSWDPVDQDGGTGALDRLLPRLDGELGLHLRRGGPATLVFDARYHPPGGSLGTAVDVLALSRVARGTVERLLEEVAAKLAAEAVMLGPGSNGSPKRDLPDHHGARSVTT